MMMKMSKEREEQRRDLRRPTRRTKKFGVLKGMSRRTLRCTRRRQRAFPGRRRPAATTGAVPSGGFPPRGGEEEEQRPRRQGSRRLRVPRLRFLGGPKLPREGPAPPAEGGSLSARQEHRSLLGMPASLTRRSRIDLRSCCCHEVAEDYV